MDERYENSKEAGWQRRLIDLSLKNNLLNFRFKRDCLHIYVADISAFCAALENCNKYTLQITPSPEEFKFGGFSVKNAAEIIDLELKSAKMRCYAPQDGLDEVTASLIRKARTSEEEGGANTLYLALGFLKWRNHRDGEDRYAPVILMPVKLRRHRNLGIMLETGEEYEVNEALIEFLKREFEIDLRGADFKGLSPDEIISVFRAKTAHMCGWIVYEDVYIAQFTFARYAMWADVKNNIETFKKNPLIASLIEGENKLVGNKMEGASEDNSDPSSVLVPLPCDSAQFSAVAESARGTTFVLHGPPGTGKSQTITNIISNVLAGGKRVLFVAQKQAALQVVKKRLTDIGLGDFCLELHSGKTANKGEIIRTIENTLALSSEFDAKEYDTAAERIKGLRRTIKDPMTALHKKRRIGVSVYEGIVNYLKNKNAPDLINIESAFYDGLTKTKLEECESMLSCARAAANECGGVQRSPFKGVNLTEFNKKTRSSVLCSCKAVLAELRHLKNYLKIFLDAFNQKIPRLTYKKLENLITVCKTLQSGSLSLFFDCDEQALHKFYNASVRYDSEMERWLSRFKSFPDITEYLPKIEGEIKNWGENYRSSRTVLAVLKKINRCVAEPLEEGEELGWIKRAFEIESARQELLSVKELSAAFTGFNGINEKKRAHLLRPLYEFHSLCQEVFTDYNADSFNSVCVNCAEALDPLITGFISAATSFLNRLTAHLGIIGADKPASDGDLFDYYTKKCGALIENIDMLPAWCKYKATTKALKDSGLTFMSDAMESGRISGDKIISSFRKNVYRNFIRTTIPADECLSQFSAGVLEESSSAFSAVLDEFAVLTRQKIRADLISRLPSSQCEGVFAEEMVTFQRNIKGNQRAFKLRELFNEIPKLLKVVSPCVLMSPETVSKFLPADPELFDIVIFDEASQIPTCEAVPALARAKSAIIVGDPKQMPPTTFFSGVAQDDENPETDDMESVLEDCLALGIAEKHLIWHYRSKHESLIAFSNVMYYSSKLCTFPSPNALESKVNLRYIENGVYERGLSKCNRAEAEALVNEVIERLKDETLSKSSIGIVTFSTPQQLLIERMLTKAITANRLEEAAYEREEPIFVKNLENVQGDERDVILFSVCYGPDRAGKIYLNFGPLNGFGGWRRLNVAVSRAREEMLVFSSMRYLNIDLSRTNSQGVANLKAFLEFAEKGTISLYEKGDRIIENKQGIARFIADELDALGYKCLCNVGVSDFRIDVGVLDPADKNKFVLAILTDGNNKFSIKDRAVMQPQCLKRGGWNVYRLYSISFFNNPKREIKKIKELLDKLTQNTSQRRTPLDIISLAREMLKNKACMYSDEIIPALLKKMNIPRTSQKIVEHINSCIEEGVKRGIFIKSVSDKISLK